jgi:CRISPR-associated protein Cmr2
VKNELRDTRNPHLSVKTLWGRILQSLGENYLPPKSPLPQRPKDFNVFREFTHGKEYLGLIYADANNMGKALENLETLQEVKEFAEKIDNAVFEAMGHAIRIHLPIQGDTFPFDILLVGGDDIAMVTPADKAIQVAHTLAEQFHQSTEKYTLSIGVVLAPVKYPFSLQYTLVEDTLKAAKKSGAKSSHNTSSNDEQKQSRISFVVITGNTSLNYQKQYEEMHCKSTASHKNEFYATLRPYTLSDLVWLLDQLKEGNKMRLGRTKLHQLREAILKLNQTTTILQSLALLRNWRQDERRFIKQMVQQFDTRLTSEQHQMGTLFPWSLDGKESSNGLTIYRTPLLDFIELYDFVSS